MQGAAGSKNRKEVSTAKQRQLIAIGCGKLGIDEDMRHEMLYVRFGVDSSTRLTRLQAAEFLRELGQRGFRIRRRVAAPRPRTARTGAERKPGADVVRLASKEEIDKIQAVAGLIRWKYADGLDRWMAKRMGVQKVRTAHEAWLVIEGLKKMFENGMRRQYGPRWWVPVYEDPGIEAYKTEHCPVRYRLHMEGARSRVLRGCAMSGDLAGGQEVVDGKGTV